MRNSCFKVSKLKPGDRSKCSQYYKHAVVANVCIIFIYILLNYYTKL